MWNHVGGGLFFWRKIVSSIRDNYLTLSNLVPLERCLGTRKLIAQLFQFSNSGKLAFFPFKRKKTDRKFKKSFWISDVKIILQALVKPFLFKESKVLWATFEIIYLHFHLLLLLNLENAHSWSEVTVKRNKQKCFAWEVNLEHKCATLFLRSQKLG